MGANGGRRERLDGAIPSIEDCWFQRGRESRNSLAWSGDTGRVQSSELGRHEEGSFRRRRVVNRLRTFKLVVTSLSWEGMCLHDVNLSIRLRQERPGWRLHRPPRATDRSWDRTPGCTSPLS